MKIKLVSNLLAVSLSALLVVLASGSLPQPVSARGPGPELTLMKIDSSRAPEYTMQASVLDATAAASVDLNNAAFELIDSTDNGKIAITGVQSVNAGIAVVIVADLGGLGGARPSSDYGKPNTQNVEALARELVAQLRGDGANPDYVGLITLVGEGTDAVKIDPSATVEITPDPVAVANTLDKLKTVNVGVATAMFDGVERAMDMLTKNPNAAVKADLDRRRKIIVVYSDGADDKFSNQSFLAALSDRARKDKVNIFAIQVNKSTNERATSNMQALAKQGDGAYALYDDSIAKPEADAKIQALNKIILSQRTQYVLPFQLARPTGEYTARLMVKTKDGNDSTEVKFTSRLKSPTVRITAPANGVAFDQKGAEAIAPILLSTEVNFADATNRSVTVEFIVDGKSVGKAVAPPYQFEWRPPAEIRQSNAMTVTHTVGLIVNDSLLNISNTGETVNYVVRVSELPPIAPEGWWVWALRNLPLVIGLCGVGLFSAALLLLLIMMNSRNTSENKKLRQQIAMIQQQGGLGGVIRSITQRLGVGGGQKASAELRVLTGPHKDIIFPITQDVTVVGRDTDPGMLSLSNDPYVSGKHLQIMIIRNPNNPQTVAGFSIVHTSNNNPTKVNGVEIPNGIQHPLQHDNIIEIGQSQMKFQVGRFTVRLPLPTQLATP